MATTVKRLAALLAAVVLATTACAYGGTPLEPAAMTIDGTTVPVDQLLDELDFLAENPAAASVLVSGDIETAGGAYEPAAAAQLLSLHAQAIILADQLDALGGTVDDEDLRRADEQLPEIFSGVDPTTGQPLGGSGGDVVASMPATLRDLVTRLVATSSAVGALVADDPAAIEITDDDVRRFYDLQADQLETQVCVRHILTAFTDDPSLLRDPTYVPSDEEVGDARARIEDAQARLASGEDFATVAEELSDDAGSAEAGGELECSPASQYVPEFAEAALAQPVGEVGEPVRTSFGFHLLEVTERTEASFEAYRDQIREELELQAADPRSAAGILLGLAAFDVDARIDPRFGSWDPAAGGVVPPEGAASPPGVVEGPSLAGLGV